MSTDYNVRCMTCSEAKGELVESWLDECREPALLALVIQHRQAFEKMGEFMEEPMYSWFAGADHGPTLMLARFFADHVGHGLKVFSEYGDDWARRDELCECGHPLNAHYGSGCFIAPSSHPCLPHEFKAKETP